MRKLLGLLLAFGVLLTAYAADQTVIVNGKTVILHDNFTWEYQKATPAPATTGKAQVLTKPANASLVLKSDENGYKINLDPKAWKQTKSSNEAAEFQFSNKDQTAFGMTIFEGASYDLETLKNILIVNAKTIDPNAHLISAEPATVNGIAGQLVTYVATAQNLDFTFLSFITSSDSGTIQYTFYTFTSMFDKQKPIMLKAISGLEF